ncbi:hypothetical protein Spa11_24870 [Botrimarina mediterranea]|uniref:Uncharacterized protein n=2 Tax=Botrimarina mediterranea TaxID=2528022 RepID=A0A518K921_9BACT|nr:hypothetical protein Spa11_24870 [Botrimarina mediterranea]
MFKHSGLRGALDFASRGECMNDRSSPESFGPARFASLSLHPEETQASGDLAKLCFDERCGSKKTPTEDLRLNQQGAWRNLPT